MRNLERVEVEWLYTYIDRDGTAKDVKGMEKEGPHQLQ